MPSQVGAISNLEAFNDNEYTNVLSILSMIEGMQKKHDHQNMPLQMCIISELLKIKWTTL